MMKINSITVTLIIISSFFMRLYSLGPHSDTVKIMPFVKSASYCIKCHSDKKSARLLLNPALSCDTYCMTCHRTKKEINDKHHAVKVRLNFKPKFAFRLSVNNRIMCITCHDLNGKRYDSISWKSESLYERLFKKKSRFKTFYLVMRNNEGKLCSMCHY
jgi:hypothetical protein